MGGGIHDEGPIGSRVQREGKECCGEKKIGELHCGASSNEGESRFQSVRLRVKLFELTCGPSESAM